MDILFFLSDYMKIHSRRPNFFAAAIIFIKWNLKERKRGNCTVWKNWFKIWQVFGLWIFISQFSSNIIEIYVIWEFKESLYRYTYISCKDLPHFWNRLCPNWFGGHAAFGKGASREIYLSRTMNILSKSSFLWNGKKHFIW